MGLPPFASHLGKSEAENYKRSTCEMRCNALFFLFHMAAAYHFSYYSSILTFLSILYLLAVPAAPSPIWQKKKHKYDDGRGNWLNHGGNIYNWRYAEGETKISPSTAGRLRLKWKFNAGRDISATPAIYKGTLYFPSWNGYLYAVKAADGSLVWKQNLKMLTGIDDAGLILNVTTTAARATPAIAGDDHDMLIIGLTGPAYIIAVTRTTGRLLWSTKLENHPYAVITMSGTYHDGSYYTGVSSLEETASIEECCTFRGSFVKLDARTGTILWQTYMLPDNRGKRGEYAGAAIWGSSPSIDVRRNLVYIATGNLYSAPQRIQKCQEEENNQTIPSQPDRCIEPDNHSNSILALDMESGKIKWFKQLGGYDVWFIACSNSSNPNCPVGPNPDADFGEAPMMLNLRINGTQRDIVTAVQKSGMAWTLDRDNGEIVWSTEAGPGGTSGGGIWGAATDKKRIYTNIGNSNRSNFTLGPPFNRVTNGGGWVAMDASTGKILWATGDPKNATVNPVTVANGVLFGGSTYVTGPVYAINAKTGKILWSYETGATVYGGVSVSNGCIYVGHGYKVSFGSIFPSVTGGTYLFAFCVA